MLKLLERSIYAAGLVLCAAVASAQYDEANPLAVSGSISADVVGDSVTTGLYYSVSLSMGQQLLVDLAAGTEFANKYDPFLLAPGSKNIKRWSVFSHEHFEAVSS